MPANVTQAGQKDDFTHGYAELGKEGTVASSQRYLDLPTRWREEEGRGRQRMPDMPNVRQRMHDDSGNGDWLTGRPLALFDAGGRFKPEGGEERGLNEVQGFRGIQEAHYRYPCPASIHGRFGLAGATAAVQPEQARASCGGAEKLKGRNPESATTGSTWPLTVGRAHLRLFHLLALAPHHGLRRLGQWNLSRTRPAVPAIGCKRANKTFQNVIGNSDPRAVPALAAAGGGGGGPRYAASFPFFQHLDLEGKSSPQEESFWFATTSTKGRRPLVFQRLSAPPASTRGDDAMKPRLAHLGPDVAVSAG
ncbi:hypothetical protein NEUTE1DRAFT_114178 [Neurospora tetrasperma FGSC 2508]|uniref:Uncharacterized protein n=1 Tax=Neurospora tetrasperma (strain FGSC 2508 / ATCC MYA-4615 / P0657) TaxID=510951 RepID=F8N0P2_NEUT8|nr:uncharacterized protein NEUTE1DRAFT_114178 [Neurospora tetrasperma FGSC 2508]EGO52182.1 hypothetical protein NEUTE1DRAFT_114178 [Neurospora tetrasperma FGSC 2508]